MDEEEVKTVFNALYPVHPTRLDQEDDFSVDDMPDFSQEELFIAIDSLRSKKAPGPDGIPAEIIKIDAHESPSLMLRMYNKCIRTGVFNRQDQNSLSVCILRGLAFSNATISRKSLRGHKKKTT